MTLNHRERKDKAMDFEEIRYDVVDHVLTITLNRPERLNAFTPTMGRELIEAFHRQMPTMTCAR